MPWSIGAGGVWKTVSGVWAGAGGAWKSASQAFVGASSAWKTSLQRIALTAANYVRAGSSPCTLTFDSGGALSSSNVAGVLTYRYDWKLSGAGSDYDIRTTSITGDGFTSDPSAGSWINLGTTRTFTRGAGINQNFTVTATFEIRDAVTLVVLASASIYLECDRS